MGKLTADWFEMYREKYSVKPMWSGKEAAMLKRTLAWADGSFEDGEKEVRLAMGKYLASEGKESIERHPFSFFATNPVKWVSPSPTPPAPHVEETIAQSPPEVQAKVTFEPTFLSDDDLRAMILSKPRASIAGMLCWADSRATLSKEALSYRSDLYQRVGVLIKELFGEEWVKEQVVDIRRSQARWV